MPFSFITVIGIVAIAAITTFYGPRLTGQVMAWQEYQRLQKAGADPDHINPPAQNDSFAGDISSAWAFDIVNGAGLIGHAPAFHNINITLDNGLTIAHAPDLDFDDESPASRQPASERYNNATLIGFQGYQPTPDEDVLFQARMQVSPDFYGTAGFVLEPQGTVLADGSFQGRFKNQAFNLFGICFIGPESNLYGKNGVTVERAINWWPEEVQKLEIDMHAAHVYQLRLHWVNEQTWLGVTSVDGQVLSKMTLPPFGPLEAHLWSDNYALGTSFSDTPTIAFQNGPDKWVRFEDVSAWTEVIQP